MVSKKCNWKTFISQIEIQLLSSQFFLNLVKNVKSGSSYLWNNYKKIVDVPESVQFIEPEVGVSFLTCEDRFDVIIMFLFVLKDWIWEWLHTMKRKINPKFPESKGIDIYLY